MKELALGIFLFALISFSLAVVGSATNLITIPWLKFDRQVQMERDIVKKTYDADNALSTYHWFKQQKEDIEATESKIVNAKQSITDFEVSAGARSTWTFEDKQEHARLSSVVTGLKNHYEQQVADYNAKAKSVDKSVFKDELPLFWSIKAY